MQSIQCRCLIGIESIISHSKEDPGKHSSVFRVYQLCLCYINELDGVALKKLLDFPFHQLMDVKLADIPYQFSKNSLPLFLKLVLEFPTLNHITQPRLAIKQYEILQVELNKLHQFMHEFKDRLKKIYFIKTNVKLLIFVDNLI